MGKKSRESFSHGKAKRSLLHRLVFRYQASKKKWDRAMFIVTFIIWLSAMVGTAYILKENCGC